MGKGLTGCVCVCVDCGMFFQLSFIFVGMFIWVLVEFPEKKGIKGKDKMFKSNNRNVWREREREKTRDGAILSRYKTKQMSILK